MKLSRITRLLTGACILLASASLYAADNTNKVVATVNGTPITQRTVNEYVQLREARRPNVRISHNQVVDELVNSELLYQQALKEKLENRADVRHELVLQRKNVLITAALRAYLRKSPISNAALKKEYDKRVASSSVKEYKARHILTKTKAEAEAVIAQLNKGANFAKLAKEKSIGPSAKQGGDLGWFTVDRMVPAFSAAVAKLKKGEYTKKPVKTRFGWHVIQLENERTMKPPKFAQVKAQLANLLRNQRIHSYIGQLRKHAKIVIKK